jgi:hypothetical protein
MAVFFVGIHSTLIKSIWKNMRTIIPIFEFKSNRMISRISFFIFFSFFNLIAFCQFTPKEFLGYELGEKFTRHHEVVNYFKAMEKTFPANLKVEKYGKTYENRDLILAYIGTSENLQKLEQIRTNHVNLGKNENVAIVWLSYNVHGNESSGTEAAMETVFRLLTDKKELLKNTIVIMDPCLNPDGRERFVNFYYQYGNRIPDKHSFSAEHNEPWPSGRPNHYLFDLNRDWAWMTQIETQKRLQKFNDWLPHVHVDFHEQAMDEPYYFPPAAEPYHQVITDWQREFQKDIGRKHASEFDKNKWLYFSKEVFDLLYPSYGDTYPMYSGSIGMTYEQGGSGRAGLSVLTKVGDTLKLKDRILHHVTTGLSTIELSSTKADILIKEYYNYRNNKKYKYKSYVFSGKEELLEPLISLLQKNKIILEFAPENTIVKAYNYQNGKNDSYVIKKGDILVSVDQEKGTLATVLLEPKTHLSDSLTYDVTAWNLPYAFGIDAFASESKINGKPFSKTNQLENRLESSCYAYLARWNSLKSTKFLADLQSLGIKVSFHDQTFKLNNQIFEPGTLIINRGENNDVDFDEKVTKIADQNQIRLSFSATGYVDEGLDFGSSHVKPILKKKVGLLMGNNASSLSVGEVWHFFEQQLESNVHLFWESELISALSEINTLIIPEGSYDLSSNESLKKWIEHGGNLIVLGSAVSSFANDESGFFGIKRKEIIDTTTRELSYGSVERNDISETIIGAVYKCELDKTHPLNFGFNRYETLRQSADIYELQEGVNVVRLGKNPSSLNGFVGSGVNKMQSEAVIAGIEEIGQGQVIYFIDNPLFRGFWERGKLLFSNAVYLVGN